MSFFTAADLAALRAMNTDAMPDEGTISRAATSAPVFDPEDGSLTPAAPTTIYSGDLRVKTGQTEDNERVQGQTEVTKTKYVGVFPWEAPEPLIDDIVSVTASSDPLVAGQTFRVVGVAFSSYLVDRRVRLELVA